MSKSGAEKLERIRALNGLIVDKYINLLAYCVSHPLIFSDPNWWHQLRHALTVDLNTSMMDGLLVGLVSKTSIAYTDVSDIFVRTDKTVEQIKHRLN